jgi:hypothetical protein
MGCAPHPRKSEGIPKTNAQPSYREINHNKENQAEPYRVTRHQFEDIANHDLNIHQERRVNVEVLTMDFVNKCQQT